MLGRAEKGLAQLKNAWYGRKNTRHRQETLGTAEKCSEEKKRSSADQQCAYKRSIVFVGHSKYLLNSCHPAVKPGRDSLHEEHGCQAGQIHFRSATAQQNFCYGTRVRHPSSIRPSVKPIFSEIVKQINAEFGGKALVYNISRPFFKIYIFIRQIHNLNSCILLGRFSTKVVQRIMKFQILAFCRPFLFFSFY